MVKVPTLWGEGFGVKARGSDTMMTSKFFLKTNKMKQSKVAIIF